MRSRIASAGTFAPIRILLALLIAGVIYGASLGAGSVLYASGTIATGATHNDCEDFKHLIAEEQGIDEEDVEQSEIKARTQECLDDHELTEREAFREEYLFWPVWPAGICALIFLLWPLWARVLSNQEHADEAEGEAPTHD